LSAASTWPCDRVDLRQPIERWCQLREWRHQEEVAVDNCLGTSTSLWPLCCEWSRNISNARVGVHCEERVLGVRAEPDQRDIGPLSRGHRPDFLDIDLARDHLVSEPGRDPGEQLEPIPLLVGDQYPADAGSRVLSRRPKMQQAVHLRLLRGNQARLLFAAPQRNRCRERLRGVRKQPAPRKDPPSRGRPEQGAGIGALVELELATGGSETASDVQQATAAPAGSDGRPPPSPARPSTCQVSHDRGSSEVRFTRETVAELLAAEGFFWLDLDRPTAADFDVLREAFGIPSTRGRGLRALRTAGEDRRLRSVDANDEERDRQIADQGARRVDDRAGA
jgi:hypothetical protein